MEFKKPTVGSKVMAPRSLWCNDRYIILVFTISRPFELRFQPVNSLWNDNLITFAMELVSTRSRNRIKIRVFGPTQDRLRVKFGQIQSN